MIFLVNRDDWNIIIKSGKEGVFIIDGHLIEDDYEWYLVEDIGGRHLLGKVKLLDRMLTNIAKVNNQQVVEVGFPSRNALKRILLPFAPEWRKKVEAITVVKFRVMEAKGIGVQTVGVLIYHLHNQRNFGSGG